jgi:hypothetical protein
MSHPNLNMNKNLMSFAIFIESQILSIFHLNEFCYFL